MQTTQNWEVKHTVVPCSVGMAATDKFVPLKISCIFWPTAKNKYCKQRLRNTWMFQISLNVKEFFSTSKITPEKWGWRSRRLNVIIHLEQQMASFI